MRLSSPTRTLSCVSNAPLSTGAETTDPASSPQVTACASRGSDTFITHARDASSPILPRVSPDLRVRFAMAQTLATGRSSGAMSARPCKNATAQVSRTSRDVNCGGRMKVKYGPSPILRTSIRSRNAGVPSRRPRTRRWLGNRLQLGPESTLKCCKRHCSTRKSMSKASQTSP